MTPDFIIDLPSGSSPVIPGNYTLRFTGIVNMPANLEKGYKAAIRFEFEVAEGELTGSGASRICTVSAGSKAELPRFLTALMGKAPEPGRVDVSPFVGKLYMGIVATSPQGKGVRVESIFPLNK
jgi:hypothetical protein